ncbi:exodeoxyribonuclease V subunit beta [Neptunicella sp. SCSIO 80796]|uniref:exodeoxyribonuclease V subunit beta n=1 Tax=Neptunicella plasticusilytica TaxID=3117012 RepID=UPI003A4DEF34
MSQLHSIQMQKLNVSDLPLHGRHVIEASAGTGKTYNITKLYLRLLLEKKLGVQQILVVTFTKAATEELRGRIAQEIRDALAQTERTLSAYRHESNNNEELKESRDLLHKALLHMDEAAISTIHGFCKQALQQQAYLNGVPPEANLEVDCSDLLMDTIRDWLRSLSAVQLALLNKKDPQQFYQTYRDAIESTIDIQPVLDEKGIAAKQQEIKLQLKNLLLPLADDIQLVLVEEAPKNPNRAEQWQQVSQWLESPDCSVEELKKAYESFFKKDRAIKSANSDALEKVKPLLVSERPMVLFKQIEKLQNQKASIPARQLITSGIEYIRRRFAQTKLAASKLDVNDLVVLLSQQLQSDHAEKLADALGKQYPVALVDEFQDTDAHQYGIFERLYPAGCADKSLFMIGDPKQAIYRFRGGDIFTYLNARQAADFHWVMDTNWRSTPQVISGYNCLFQASNQGDSVFGQGIEYMDIGYPAEDQLRSSDADIDDPDGDIRALNFVIDSPDMAKPDKGLSRDEKDQSQQHIVDAMVAEIQRLLAQVTIKQQPLQAGDIAILVPKGTLAQLVQDSLREHGINSVYLSDRQSVYQSVEAEELKRVMDGILAFHDDRKLVAALSTRLLGGDSQLLFDLQQPDNDSLWQQKRDDFALLRHQWDVQGFLPMMMGLIHDAFQPDPQRHERSLTNILHLLELLQKASQQFRYPAQLQNWFVQQIELQDRAETSEQRLESEANLIKISTLHGSKGLEYPFVFIPFATEYSDPVKRGNSPRECLKYYDHEAGYNRFCLQPDEQVSQWVTQEDNAEKARLLYVAVTRAIYRCYVGASEGDKNIALTPLGLVSKVEPGQELFTRLQNLAESESAISVMDNQQLLAKWHPGQSRTHSGGDNAPAVLGVSRFNGEISAAWRISSFSAITRFSQHTRLDHKERVDQAVVSEAAVIDQDAPLRFTLAKGAHTGNLLHDSLELLDFSQADNQTNWDDAFALPVQAYADPELDIVALQAWLTECLATELPSLYPQQEKLRLQDLDLQHTSRESEFYFDMHTHQRGALGQFLAEYRQQPDNDFNLPDDLQGMMHGFIDLIFEHQGRYYVVDYKSTHLGHSLSDYSHSNILVDMQTHFYDLQYLIYTLALHRHLSATLPDYDPQRHLGGVYYLYLRGMSPGSDNGIYATSVTAEQVRKLDNLFKVQVFAGETA